MDTFPWESWDEALAAAAENADAGYFTFGPGGNSAMVVLTILAIALALAWMVQLTNKEARELNESAQSLNEKWGA